MLSTSHSGQITISATVGRLEPGLAVFAIIISSRACICRFNLELQTLRRDFGRHVLPGVNVPLTCVFERYRLRRMSVSRVVLSSAR